MSTIGNKEYSVEFNDSVFESQAWKKPRYEGQELSGAQINRYTEGDVSFGKTPVIRNVSRNIYIGNAIIPLGDIDASGDETLVQFPSSSYITIQKYITVNSDDSISENNYDGSNLDSKKGFYRPFYEDFPIGGDFQLKILDDTVDNFTLDNYKVFFNQGRLHQIGHYVNSTDIAINGTLSVFRYGDSSQPSGTALGGTFTLFQNSFLHPITTTTISTYGNLNGFFGDLGDLSIADNTNRYFATFHTNSIDTPIFLNPSTYPQVSLGRYSTAELYTANKTGLSNRQIPVNGKFKWLRVYGSINDAENYTISKLNNSIPSILTNLYQPEQLPSNTGNAPFIIIPSNIHPYIKDNLTYFLDQAGIDIGNNTAPGKIVQQNRKLT